MKRQTFVPKEPFALLTPWLIAQLFELEGRNFSKSAIGVGFFGFARGPSTSGFERKKGAMPAKVVALMADY
jgi:hypothetical protein